jgi:hypothetical protein
MRGQRHPVRLVVSMLGETKRPDVLVSFFCEAARFNMNIIHKIRQPIIQAFGYIRCS